jgi:pilus assembly protein CpaD
MSSNRRTSAIIRALLAAVLAATAAGCATAPKPPPEAPRQGLTSTEQFEPTITSHQDQILLAAHTDGLSPAQARALTSLVDRWRDTGSGPIVIQAPSHGGGEAYRSAMAIQDALAGLGLRDIQVKLVGYEASTAEGAPVIVGFASYEARGPKCGQDWDAFTRSATNKPNSNFGCAITANIAAMVANPADLVGPRASDPSDAQRRDTVLGKYRSGSLTSSAKDGQAGGAVSTAVP